MRKHKPLSFDELLVELQGQRTKQEDPNLVTFDKLFHETFMKKHSSFDSFDAFLVKGNFQAKTHEDIHNLNDELFDRHVARETDFASWKEMLAAAKADYEGISSASE